MKNKYRILGITSGGFEGFSGVNNNLFSEIGKKYELIDIVDNKLSGFWKYYNALYCFLKTPGFNKYIKPFNEIYHGETSYYRFRTNYYFVERTKAAERILKERTDEYDVILQTGWIPAILEQKQIPRCIYTDYTMKLSEKEFPQWSTFLSDKDKNKWIQMETKSYKNANAIFTSSEHTRKSIIYDYGVHKEKVLTVYEGTDIEKIPDIDKKYDYNIILFVGVDFERKGGYILLNAFKKIREEIKDARLIIIGSRPKINIEGVEVKGFVSYIEKMHYFSIASVFTMPSFAEPFGLVFLEAMAHKIPCIGTNVCAMPEIIQDFETGYLVEPNNSEELADRVISILKDHELARKMGTNGRKRVEELFTWEKVVKRMSIEFDKLI
ncbi:glycosyltransferase family 4 protein [Methanosarcina mazei]|uniref:Glycosyltransferase n=1 Tax=Methanosarcina mazei LYC TaxID=1434114 RepID=A0A0E3RT47_METMZ|nr:glycosyltransferase family 4 protein [Methanosarcina mazei]AKB69080.1 Glycosyltransferase [Methanosarcina mazei LYC]